MKSPPNKIRVPDKDQRVYDDDESLDEDLIFELQNDIRDSMDDNYEPQANLQQDSDEYDLEDSFIDDSTISMSFVSFEQHLRVEIESDEELGGSGATTGRPPYPLRRTSAQNRQSNDVIINIPDDGLELSDSSSSDDGDLIASRNSFIVYDEDDDDDDDDDDDWSDTQESQEMPTPKMTKLPARPSRTARPHHGTNSSRNRASKPSRNRASSPTRASRKNMAEPPPRATRRSSRQLAKQQADNERSKGGQTIPQTNPVTWSSGWLSTNRRRSERASAALAARAISQTVTEQQSPRTTRNNRLAATKREPQKYEQDTDDDNADFVPANARKRKLPATRRKYSSDEQFSQDPSDSDDSDADIQIVAVMKGIHRNGRPMRSVENTSARNQKKAEEESKERAKWKGKENAMQGRSTTPVGMRTRHQTSKLYQQTIDKYKTQAFKPGEMHTNRRSNAAPLTRSRYYGNHDDDDDGDDDDDDDTDENSVRYNDSHDYTNKHSMYGPSPSCSYSKDDDDELEDEITSVLMPTPQGSKRRSFFTRRQHRPLTRGFYDDSDTERKKSSSTNHLHQPLIPETRKSNPYGTHDSKVKRQFCNSSPVAKRKPCKTRRRIQDLGSDSE